MFSGPFVHNLDPVLADIGGVYLWHYGLFYTLGFLILYLWLRMQRQQIGLTLKEVYDLSILSSLGVLIGGRLVAVIFYEWSYYGNHLDQIPAYWIGGMGSHGFISGVVIAIWLFCRLKGKSFFQISDAIVIPAAFLLGLGRFANFIDGQIVGSLTDVWWAVQFPDAEGYRHPVVLYDGAKNFLLVPLLLYIRHKNPPRGVLTAHFILWYGFFRIFIDIFRDYRTDIIGIPPGQIFNASMAIIGVALLFWFYWKQRDKKVTADTLRTTPSEEIAAGGLWWRKIIFGAILVFSLVIPSDHTQDIPLVYGKRHPGLQHSALYPPIVMPH